jgi:uncharacterized protein (DUF362 family)
MKRRSFLRLGSQALAAGLAGAAGVRRARGESQAPVADSANPAGATPDSAAAGDRWPDLLVARGAAETALPAALAAFGGLGRFVRSGEVVVIKPNAGFASPAEWGATTDPAVLGALIAACLEADARRVLVVDHTLAPAERAFARSGIGDAVAGFPQAKLVSLDEQRLYQEVAIPQGQALQRTDVAQAVLRADVLINLPTAKAHSATGVSFGLKNLMGLIWDRTTFHRDMDIHAGIADLATVIRPDLTILDAMTLLQTGGPEGPGEIEPYGGLVLGCDPVAVDAYAVGLGPWNHQTMTPAQVGYLRYAAQRGVGRLDLDSLQIREIA